MRFLLVFVLACGGATAEPASPSAPPSENPSEPHTDESEAEVQPDTAENDTAENDTAVNGTSGAAHDATANESGATEPAEQAEPEAEQAEPEDAQASAQAAACLDSESALVQEIRASAARPCRSDRQCVPIAHPDGRHIQLVVHRRDHRALEARVRRHHESCGARRANNWDHAAGYVEVSGECNDTCQALETSVDGLELE